MSGEMKCTQWKIRKYNALQQLWFKGKLFFLVKVPYLFAIHRIIMEKSYI